MLDRSRVNTVISGVNQDSGLVNKGLNKLFGNGSQAGVMGGGWATVDNLASNAGNANWGITSFTLRLYEAYQDMVTALHQASSKISDTDDDVAGAAKSIRTDIETGA